MTAFLDLIDLQTAVVEMVQRPDIADVFPRLVKLAEADFNRRLRMAEQIEIKDVTISGGSASLPYGLQSLIGVYNGAGYEYVAQPPQAIRTAQSKGYYAIIGDKIHAPQDEVLTLQYYAAIPSITDDQRSSSWLLERHPGLYLYAVGAEAAKYTGDGERLAAIMQALAGEYAKADGADGSRRYSRARVRVQGVTP